jgi:hypothetical protein
MKTILLLILFVMLLPLNAFADYTVTVTYRCPGKWGYATYRAKNLKQANSIKQSLTRFYKRQGRLGSVVIRVNR